MPDVIEMPYMPPLYRAKEGEQEEHCYLLAGPTCLAGNIPNIWKRNLKGDFEKLTDFGYEDFKMRLGAGLREEGS